jgi:hypothetical protein
VVVKSVGDGQDIGVECVGVWLSFLHAEESHFKEKYLEKFYKILEPQRPQYKNVAITLQPSSNRVEAKRPFRQPKLKRSEQERLIAEFGELLSRYYSDLRPTYGGLLQNLTVDGKSPFPLLTAYFEATILNEMRDDDPRKFHPDDSVITLPVVLYQFSEIETAVRNALKSKRGRCSEYKTDILLLHTPVEEGKSYFSGIGLHGDDIRDVAKRLVIQDKDLCARFKEIWFLNAYVIAGRRLYRLK